MCPKPSYKPPKLPNPFKTPIHEILYVRNVRNECHTQSKPCKRSIGQYGWCQDSHTSSPPSLANFYLYIHLTTFYKTF